MKDSTVITETSSPSLWKLLRMVAALGLWLPLFAPFANVAPAYASSVNSAAFTAGGLVVGTTRYAKSGQVLTLAVSTTSDTHCVEVTGDHSAKQATTSSNGLSSWTFTL